MSALPAVWSKAGTTGEGGQAPGVEVELFGGE